MQKVSKQPASITCLSAGKREGMVSLITSLESMGVGMGSEQIGAKAPPGFRNVAFARSVVPVSTAFVMGGLVFKLQ